MPTPATTGKVASQIGVAPRSPAQPSIARSRRLSGAKTVASEGGERAGDEDQHRRERQAFEGDVAEGAREDEQAEQDEEADLGDPADPLVEGDDRAPRRDPRRAERQRGQVDGEQAGAVRDLGQAVGEAGDRDRRHRVDAVGRQPHPVEGGDREPADARGRSRPRSPV